LDGVDIDYEYFYEDDQNGSGFTKGAQAITFLSDVTVGLRNNLPVGSIVTHAPMDIDMLPGTAYFDMLQSISYTLDFLMPQYYNGVTRPAADGFQNSNAGQMATSVHYQTLVDMFFGGDATRMVFGFCISDCIFTASNASPNQAAAVMVSVGDSYDCHGGAFFWAAQHDGGGLWSSSVNSAMDANRGCSGGIDPVEKTPTPAPGVPVPTPSPVVNPIQRQCCANNFSGNRAFNDCKSFYQCVFGSVVGAPTLCSAGLLFDAQLQICNWEDAVTSCAVETCELDPVPSPAPTPAPVTPTNEYPPKKDIPVGDSNKDGSKLFEEDDRGNLTRGRRLKKHTLRGR
jgi:hypothetical protein